MVSAVDYAEPEANSCGITNIEWVLKSPALLADPRFISRSPDRNPVAVASLAMLV